MGTSGGWIIVFNNNRFSTSNTYDDTCRMGAKWKVHVGGEYILMGLESIGSMGEKNRRKRTYAKNEITLKKLEIYSKINDNPK